MAFNKLRAVLSASYVIVQAGVPLAAYAEQANLDLASQDRNVSAGSNFQSATITRADGSTLSVSPNQLLTPAEFVALSQVLQPNGHQTIQVSAAGNALGGTVNLSAFSSIATLNIPQGVTAISDAARGSLNITGNLTNSGNLYAISTNTAYTSALISASNIFNNQGALLTSVLPTGGLADYSNAIAGLHLSLTAIHDIINAGTISSAASLSMSAGGSIINALPAGATGMQPLMQALGNINMISSQLTNAGLIASLTGNINISSQMAQDILVRNAGGTLSALNGSLNIRDEAFTGKFHLDVLGGDLLAKELNLFSGNGKVNLAVNQLVGKVNVVSNELAISANTSLLDMGNVVVTGDPIITNDAGDVRIEPDFGQSFVTGGGPLIVTASQDIIASAGIIDTAGGQIQMTAGRNIDLSATVALNSKNSSGIGGPIILKAVGGNILLNDQGSITSGGSIQLSAAGNIDVGNLSTAAGSSVVVQAGGTVATGSISTASSNKGGAVDIHSQLAGGGAAFYIGASQNGRNSNGVNGTITTTGNNVSGFVSINNGGTGDIIVDPAALNVSGPRNGGDIALNAGTGNIIFQDGTLSTSGGFGYVSGNIFLSGGGITFNNTTLDVSGFVPGSVVTSSNTLNYAGDLSINATGEIGGGLIQIMSSNSLNLSTTFDPNTGAHHLIADGNVNYSSPVSLSGSGTATLDAGGASGGGTIRIAGGDISISGGPLTMTASATGDGYGGNVIIDSMTLDCTSTVAASANGAGSGGGGVISIGVNSGGPALQIGSGAGQMSLTANGGDFGDGGTIDISTASGADVDLSGISASGANGGHVNITAGFGGSGQLNVTSGTLSVDGFYGGSIYLESASASGTLTIGSGVVLSANGADGIAGEIDLVSAHSLLMGGSVSASGTGNGAGGIVTIQAGGSSAGVLDVSGSMIANATGSGSAGQVSITANTTAAVLLSGSISASATGTGSAGNVLISRSDSADMNVNVTGSIVASASAGDGSVQFTQASGKVTVTASGDIFGKIGATGKQVDINATSNGAKLSLQNISSTAGNLTVRATGLNSTVTVLSGSTMSASGGNLTLGAANIRLQDNTHLNMDAAGLMTLDSGSPSNSLTVFLPENGTAFISMPSGGANARPGAVLVTPRDGGNVTFASSGSGTGSLEVNGATLSASTTTGNLNVASNASISSDSFDDLLNFGIELTAGAGNVNLMGTVTTSHLSVATTNGGSVVLGSEINSPTVVISATGNGTITQAPGVSIGIGSLTLSSEFGDIGSQAAALNTNVLELKVDSHANVYLNNDSSVDIKTSTVDGAFSLNNNGDVSFESAMNSNSLAVNATGSVSVLNTVQGSSGIILSANGAGNSINVTGALMSSTGGISLSTGLLTYSGIIETQAAGGHIDIFGGNSLTVTNNGGQIRAVSNGIVTFGASNNISLTNSVKVDTGANGSVGLITSGGAGSSINIGGGSTATFQVAGGGLLNMVASAVTLANGSTIRVDRTGGTAMFMGPAAAGTAFSMHLTSPSGGHLVTGGGAIQIAAGNGAPLVFDNNGQLVTSDLTVSGGALNTTSSGADTLLVNVNIVSDNNVSVNVHGGTFQMGGDVSSSKSGGVIALLDPGGLTIAGNGNVFFTGGASGQIKIDASGAGNNLTFTGNHTLNAGANGSISVHSNSSVIFGAASKLLVSGPLTIDAPVISFQSKSQLNANSSVSMTGAGLTVLAPGGGSASITAVGSIAISSAKGTALTFNTSTPGQNALLTFGGADLSLQSSNANVVVNANTTLQSDHNINISTPGGTLVNNGSIQAPNQNNTITIEASGNLLVNQNVRADNIVVRTIANNGNITLASDLEAVRLLKVSANGSGNIYQKGGSLKADQLILESGSGNIGSDNQSIKFTANSVQISTSGSAFVESKNNVQIASANVGQKLHFTSAGSLTVGAGGVMANRVRLEAGTNIVLNGNVRGTERARLIADNGSITGTGEVRGQRVVLKADCGNIGSAANFLRINADVLKVKIQHSGSAFIQEADALSVDKVDVAGGFSLRAGGNLSLNDLAANNGSLTLVSAGSIVLEEKSHLYTNEGNILIQTTNAAQGTIRIEEKSEIEAYASASGKGNVTIAVGDVPTNPVKGTAPKNVTISKRSGGEVYFGKNGIATDGKKIQLNAWGSNIIFSTGNRSASAITIEGQVEITADPPVAAETSALNAVPSVSAQNGSIAIPQMQLPSVFVPAAQPLFNSTMRLKGDFGSGNWSSFDNSNHNSAKESNDVYTAVAFATAPALTAVQEHSPAKTILGTHADIRQARNTVFKMHEDGSGTLTEGEILVQARKNITIHSGADRVNLGRGAVALVRRNKDSLELFNLYEPHSGAIEVVLGDRHSTKVGVGTSFSTGQATLSHSVASRHRHEHTVEKCKTHSAEFSLLSLASRAEIVSAMLGSRDKREHQLVEKLLKVAAALSVVTGGHGPYSDKQ